MIVSSGHIKNNFSSDFSVTDAFVLDLPKFNPKDPIKVARLFKDSMVKSNYMASDPEDSNGLSKPTLI